MPAFPAADEFSTPSAAGVEDAEVAAAAVAATPAAGVLFAGVFTRRHALFLRCNSAKLTRPRLIGEVAWVPGSTAPWVEAATAVPTRQSNQWLSARSGRCFHSSTVRPRPSVFTRYSDVRCSAKRRCTSALSPNNDNQPRC